MITANLLIIGTVLNSLQADLKLSSSALGAVLGSFSLCAMLGNLAIIFIAKPLNPRHSFVAGHILVMIGTLCFTLSDTATSLVISRGIIGLSMPLIGSSIYPLLPLGRPSAYKRIAALVATGGSIATFSIVPLALALSEQYNWRATMAIQLTLGFLGLATFYIATPYNPTNLQDTTPTNNKSPLDLNGILSSGQFFFMSYAYFILSLGLPSMLIQTFNSEFASTALVTGGISALAAATLYGSLSPIQRQPQSLWMYISITGILLIALGHSQQSAVAVGWALYNFSRQILSTQLLVEATSKAEPSMRTRINAAFNLAFQISGAIAGACIPWLISHPAASSVLSAVAITSLAMALALYLARRACFR